jgi:hypothetical protein
MAMIVSTAQARRPIWLMPAILVALVVIGRFLASGVSDDQLNPLVVFTHLYALVLVAGLTWLAAGVGHLGLRKLRLPTRDPLEHWVFSLGLGLGVTAYVVLGLGLIGLLSPSTIALAIAALASIGDCCSA